jgi:hypothetical protein
MTLYVVATLTTGRQISYKLDAYQAIQHVRALARLFDVVNVAATVDMGSIDPVLPPVTFAESFFGKGLDTAN